MGEVQRFHSCDFIGFYWLQKRQSIIKVRRGLRYGYPCTQVLRCTTSEPRYIMKRSDGLFWHKGTLATVETSEIGRVYALHYNEVSSFRVNANNIRAVVQQEKLYRLIGKYNPFIIRSSHSLISLTLIRSHAHSPC